MALPGYSNAKRHKMDHILYKRQGLGQDAFSISTSRTARASLVSARRWASSWACNHIQRNPRLLVGPGSTCQVWSRRKGLERNTYVVKRLPLIPPVHEHDAVHHDNCQQSISSPSTTLELSHTCNCRQLRQLNHLVPSWPLRNVRHPPLVPLLKMQLLLLGELGEVWRPHLFQAGGTRY